MEIFYTRSSGRSAPLLLAPAEGLGALWAPQGSFGPILSSSIQKYTLRQLFGHLELYYVFVCFNIFWDVSGYFAI